MSRKYIRKYKPYTKKWLTQLCAESFSIAEVLRKVGRSGGGASYLLKKVIEKFGIDISHFTGALWSKGKTAKEDPRIYHQDKYTLAEVLIQNSPFNQSVTRHYVQKYNVIPYKCETCGCDGNWQGSLIALELHHRDGNNTNNTISNLVYLCPNCHALTNTFRRCKKSIHRKFISEKKFVKALKDTPNIRRALILLGLSARGSNYKRAIALINKYNIKQS